MLETKVKGIQTGHIEIRPACRENRGVDAAFLDAAHDLFAKYQASAKQAPADTIFHLVLTSDYEV